MTIRITIPIEPKSQQHGLRARVIRGKFMGMYNDAAKALYMDTIQNECLGHVPAEPLDGPLEVEYKFYLVRPESNTDPYPHMSKEDGDNLQKSVQDCMTKLKMWKDDCRVIHWSGWKLWAEDDLFPRIEITINTLTP